MSYSNAGSAGFQQSASSPVNNYGPGTPPPPPPKPLDGPGTPSRGPPLPPPPPQQSTYEGPQGTLQASYGEPAQSHVAPPEHGWLPAGLVDKSTQDLHSLVEDTNLQIALLNNPQTSHSSIQASEAPLKHLLEANVALAHNVEQLEQRLTAQRAATQSRLLSLRALEQQHRTKIAETEDKLKGFSPMALYQRLNASVQEQNALIKGIEDSFLEHGGVASDREISDFVRRVRDAKKVAFLRTERKERWDEGRVGGWR